MSRTIRVDEETYTKLAKHAGKLQLEQGKPVSINEAIQDLTEPANTITDLAGTWNITDKEYQKIIESLKEGWTKWKTP
jgi:predicted CopG family antitoxin